MIRKYNEPWVSNYPTKKEIIQEWSRWLESKRSEWYLFTFTVVFKKDSKFERTYDWDSEYQRVLNKIRRRLERNKLNQRFAIPFDGLSYYEKNETSIKRITGSRHPHHYHALIPIRKSQIHRFWSIDINDLQPKIRRDIESMNIVQSVLIETIGCGESINWMSYITKSKNP